MICALMMGRAGSTGFPNKNIKKVLGRRLCEYPLLASRNSKKIDKIFVSTDCPVISRVSKKYGAIHIKRPKKLANKKALGEDVFQHGYFQIRKILNLEAESLPFKSIFIKISVSLSNSLRISQITGSQFKMWLCK